MHERDGIYLRVNTDRTVRFTSSGTFTVATMPCKRLCKPMRSILSKTC